MFCDMGSAVSFPGQVTAYKQVLLQWQIVMCGFMGSDWFRQRNSKVSAGDGEELGTLTFFPALWDRAALFRWFKSFQKDEGMGKGQICCGELEVQKRYSSSGFVLAWG